MQSPERIAELAVLTLFTAQFHRNGVLMSLFKVVGVFLAYIGAEEKLPFFKNVSFLGERS